MKQHISVLIITLLLTLTLQNLDHDQSISICSDTENGFQRFKEAFGKQYQSTVEEADAEQAFF